MPSLPRARSSIASALDDLGHSTEVHELRANLAAMANALPADLAAEIIDILANIDQLAADARAIAAKIDEYDAEQDHAEREYEKD